MELRRTFALGASALALAAACGESHTSEDAAIVFDATFPDAGTDSGPPPSNVGAECVADEDCAGAADRCLSEAMWGLPGGYCSAGCVLDEDCPADAICSPTHGGESICLDACDPSAPDQCRAGYGCSREGAAVCLPGCEEDSDCGAGQVCEVGGGFNGAGVCRDPDAAIGDACRDEEDCAPSTACLVEGYYGWPSGTCVGLGCDPVANTGCEGDAMCAATGDGGGICVDGCATDGCRTGYRCDALGDDPTRMACQPGCTEDSQCTARLRDGTAFVCNPGTGYCDMPFDPADLGEPCAGDWRECSGGLCMTEDETGWPAGICAYPGCRLSGEGPSATCPTAGVCIDDEAGDPELGICVDACTVGTSTCRPDYACVALTDGGTEGACRPSP